MTRRFFVEPPSLEGDAVELPGALARRLATVLRLRPGDEIVLFDGSGREARTVLDRVDAHHALARIVDRHDGTLEPRVAVHLYQSIAKAERFDWLVEKATEIGVARIVPIIAARAVVRTGASGARTGRWRRIAVEATEQCGRSVVPEIASPLSLAEALTSSPGVTLIPYEDAGREALSVAKALVTSAELPSAVSLFIGPEGGFTPGEVDQATAAGAMPVTLGPRILRSETAGLVAATLVLQATGDLG